MTNDGWGAAIRFFLIGAGLLALWYLVQPAKAATQCGTRGQMMTILKGQYKENQRATGFVNPAVVMELFVSSAGSWTVLFTSVKGRSCIVASGQQWQDILQGQQT